MGRIGGHENMTNMDTGALNHMKQVLGIQTMIDVGCGPGGMTVYAKSIGIKACGIDGDQAVRPEILHNFDDGPLDVQEADLAWSIEFLEHV